MGSTAKEPWETVRCTITAANIGVDAAMFGVPLLHVSKYYDEYVDKFRAGPDTFIPWYRLQRQLRDKGDLGGIRLPYPHEVFAIASLDNANWFYEHPAWETAVLPVDK